MVAVVRNIDQFNDSVQSWFKAVRGAAEEAAVGLAKVAFTNILHNSPQFSGDFVANWHVGLTPNAPFKKGALGQRTFEWKGKELKDGSPFQRGDMPAINYAKANAVWPKLKLGQTLYLSNSAAHDEPYAMKIEDGLIQFRSVNAGTDRVVRKSVLFLLNRYTTISKEQLVSLSRLGV